MQVNIHPLVTIYINTLLAWAKCFLATYGVYPGLYDLLDTPRPDFLAAQLHLCDSTFPRPLLPRSTGPPTLQNECVALQPHLAPPTPPNCLYVCHATSPYIIPPAPSVCQSHHKSVALSVHNTASPSVIPICQSYDQSVHHPINSSMTPQSVTPPISFHDPSVRLSVPI